MAGKHVVVSGAGTGIGRAIALRLAREGASLTLVAWDEEHLRETASRIEGATHVETCDVRQRRRVDRAFGRAADTLGPIHGLVTCSAIGGPNGEDDEGGDRFEDIVATNLYGTYYCVRAAASSPSQAMSVSTQPGQIALTWTPCGASSAANERISPRSPALEALYPVYPGTAIRARIEEKTTTCRVSGPEARCRSAARTQ